MGNSEINHAAIGSGRVIYQDLVRINKAAANGEFGQVPAFKQAFENVKQNNSSLHIMGLLSPGGVHSHQEHVFALMRAAAQAGVTKIFVHAFTDGRDVLPQSCSESFVALAQVCQETGAQLVTITGRYYAMDRDHNWDRIDLAYAAIKDRQAAETFADADSAIEASYAALKNDEFIIPCLIQVTDNEAAKVHEHDSVIFANFRNDRPRQLTERFLEKGPANLTFVTMTLYSNDYKVLVAFPPQSVANTLGEVLSQTGIAQLRVTETEKFAHLTLFMNCNREEPWPLEERVMLDSYKVTSHDLKPEMRAPEIANKIVEAMATEKYPVILANICNGDMVGHTGNIEATRKAVAVVSENLEKIVMQAQKSGYLVLITADHGNCDEMIDAEGHILTQHSLNPVPFIVVEDQLKLQRETGIMADVAPTLLRILGLDKPQEMTGQSLI
jgi:2,3-bisphosphoglycerate-independent phosphoglycerate mutase